MSDVHHHATSDDGDTDADVVEIALPARSAYVRVLRTTAATLAAQLDFTVDEIDDLRIAVHEASALLLAHAAPASTLRCQFRIRGYELCVRVTSMVDATADSGVPETGASAPLSADSFAWAVLTALADSVEAPEVPDGHASIELRKAAVAARRLRPVDPGAS